MQLRHSCPRAVKRVLQDGNRTPASIFKSHAASRWGVRRARRGASRSSVGASRSSGSMMKRQPPEGSLRVARARHGSLGPGTAGSGIPRTPFTGVPRS